jgi:hypothetical protein
MCGYAKNTDYWAKEYQLFRTWFATSELRTVFYVVQPRVIEDSVRREKKI